MVNGRRINACLTLACMHDGDEVTTIEGIGQPGNLSPLQEAFVSEDGFQCGYCTPGMLITAAELLREPKPVSREEIREHLSGNFCRCTGYHAIVDAVETTINTRLEEG